MSIIRAPRPNGQFTIIRNDVLRDRRLSFRALGVLVEVLSRPDNWQTKAEVLAQERKEGRDAIYKALGELKQFGYLEHQKVRGERGRVSTVSIVYDEPRDPSDPAGSVETDAKKPQVAPATGLPGSGQPGPGQPGSGKPGPLRSTETKTVEEDLKKKTERSSVPVEQNSLSRGAQPATNRERDRPAKPKQPKPTSGGDSIDQLLMADTDIADDERKRFREHLKTGQRGRSFIGYLRGFRDGDLQANLDEWREKYPPPAAPRPRPAPEPEPAPEPCAHGVVGSCEPCDIERVRDLFNGGTPRNRVPKFWHGYWDLIAAEAKNAA